MSPLDHGDLPERVWKPTHVGKIMQNRFEPQRERVFVIRVPADAGGILRRVRIEVKEVAAVRTFDRRKVVGDIPAAFDVIAQWLHHPTKTNA